MSLGQCSGRKWSEHVDVQILQYTSETADANQVRQIDWFDSWRESELPQVSINMRVVNRDREIGKARLTSSRSR